MGYLKSVTSLDNLPYTWAESTGVYLGLAGGLAAGISAINGYGYVAAGLFGLMVGRWVWRNKADAPSLFAAGLGGAGTAIGTFWLDTISISVLYGLGVFAGYAAQRKLQSMDV